MGPNYMIRIFSRAVFATQVFALFLLVTGLGTALAQGLDAARQQKLLAHLNSKGFNSSIEKGLAELLGVSNNGEHIPTRKVQFYNETVMYAFSRMNAGEKGYFFFFDPERSHSSSAAIMFRTDLDFRLVGVGVIWLNAKPQRLSPERTTKMFAELMREWSRGLDGKFNSLSGK
jgi:hypothetical protein